MLLSDAIGAVESFCRRDLIRASRFSEIDHLATQSTKLTESSKSPVGQSDSVFSSTDPTT